MMFRKLYWVIEGVNRSRMMDDGCSTVLGVYTSIPDLVRNGLPQAERFPGFRLSLVKLDSSDTPLGVWESPDFEGLADALKTYVSTDEFSADQCELLLQKTRKTVAV